MQVVVFDIQVLDRIWQISWITCQHQRYDWSIQGDKITLTVTHTFKLGEKVVEQTGSTGNYTVSNNLVI